MSKMTPRRRKMLAKALDEAQSLHQDWRESLQHHELRVQAQFKEVIRRLRAKPQGVQPKGLPSAKQAEHIHDALAALDVKPGKGRAKDLRHIEETLRKALDRLPNE